MGNRKRQRYLSYLVFDQQKISYYGVFDATYPPSDAELRLKIKRGWKCLNMEKKML